MRNGIWIAVLLLVCLTLAGCPRRDGEEASKLTSEEAAQARRTIVAWLECEECTEGELERVVKLGGVAVPTLEAVLSGGPSPAKQEEHRRHLVVTYEELAEYGKRHPESRIRATENEYVDMYLDNLAALYRIRAAQGLGAIGGARAKSALERAAEQPFRADVQEAIAAALKGG